MFSHQRLLFTLLKHSEERFSKYANGSNGNSNGNSNDSSVSKRRIKQFRTPQAYMDLLREVMAVLDEETGRRETMTVSERVGDMRVNTDSEYSERMCGDVYATGHCFFVSLLLCFCRELAHISTASLLFSLAQQALTLCPLSVYLLPPPFLPSRPIIIIIL